ncbi:MAG: DNA polymerase III subunit alpha, partial [Prevotella sp.]|nr:DNA polymerase III subunit alpha [Prevotella sp.]
NVHSHYSILNGCSTIQQIVDSAIKNKMPGIAITDYGNMFGIMEFIEYVARINKVRQEKGKKQFKPIIGCELYVAKHGSKEQKNGAKDIKGYHLTVLAKNLIGYKNLIKIVSNAWNDGFYAAPRTDRKDLEKYHEGLIVLSGGFSSEVFTHAMKEDMTALDDTIKWHKQVFGGDYYLEIRREADYNLSKDAQSELMIEQEKVNKVLIQKSKEHGVKVVATNDVHYVNPEDLIVYNIQQCIAVGKTLEEFDTTPLRFRWLRSKREMCDLFSDIPSAISNTMEIFDKVETYDIHHAPIMPPVSIPEGFKNDTDYLKQLTYTKAKDIYGNPLPEEGDDRLQFELEIIKKNGAERYFLFIQDVVNYAEKELDALVGPGRGSVAGSLVAYCLGITKIDPLKHDLLFERFMCPDRQMLPDIDLDFDEEGRSHVIEWLEKKYGKEYCAHIISYSTFSTRSAFSSIAQVKQLPAKTANAIHQAIPVYYPYYPKTMENAIKSTPELRKLVRSADQTVQNAISDTKVLEGTIKGIGVHACGFIVSDSPISDWAPVCVQEDPYIEGKKVRCTQYDGRTIEETGLIKFDFLSLNTLSQLKMICERIKVNTGKDFDIEKIPLDDPKTLELFQQGETEDIFQYETQGMRQYLRELHPTTFEDLVLLNVMYRPGTIEDLPLLLKRKRGRSKIKYAIPNMEKYLHDTYGILVYQEQLMLLSRLIADFNRGESDALRKAMGKRKQDKLAELKPKFIEGGLRNGYKKSTLERIWKDWEHKGMYAFNKAHAVCYSWLAYQMAYLKANYSEEFHLVIKDSQ